MPNQRPDSSPTPPFGRLIALSFAVALVSCAFGFVACIEARSIPIEIAVIASLMAVGGTFVMRWWLEECRKAGISTSKPASASLLLAALWVAGMAAIVALEYVVYDRTLSRTMEGLIAIVLSAPLTYAVSRQAQRLQPEPKPAEGSLYRFSFYMMLALPVLFGFNLAMQLTERHRYADLDGIHAFNIAIGFALISAFPINAYFARSRYLKVRDATAAL